MTSKEWESKYGAIRDRFMAYYNINVHRGFTDMRKEGCWVEGWTGEDPARPEFAVIGLMLNEPIEVDKEFEGLTVFQWKTPNE